MPNEEALSYEDLEARAEAYADDVSAVDEEALGAALYVEDIVSGEADESLEDVARYIADAEDFGFEDFIDHKAGMGRSYDRFAEGIGDVISEVDEQRRKAEATGAIYEGLFRETQNERDSAMGAINSLMDQASDIDTDFSWPNGFGQINPSENPGTTGRRGFSTWSNYNFGTQVVEDNFSTWSNYNFGIQASEFSDVEVTEGELNEDILENDEEVEEEQTPWIYNPQINFSPTIDINVGSTDFALDQAS